ncbi:MAG: TetR/AcrR family transcriptional regulator [Anaerocolumna sp.]|jgi:AcrR family transcriptional regulator|nr:TetR/AcrR family transcriptional regulator [Anaerocolumna sp.]
MSEEKNIKINNKENIEMTALELFAKHGFQAVSVRDICKPLGLRESAIYYHFANKQGILDSLLLRVDQLILQMKTEFEAAFSEAAEVSDEAMCAVAIGMLQGYLLHPVVYKMIAMLTIERISTYNAQDTYQKLVFELPLKQMEMVFAQMIDKGFIVRNAPEVLAQEYYAIIYFAFQKNCIGPELTDENIALTKQEINKNMKDIYNKMKQR